MKGDFTKITFNPAKQYSSVRMQQGRVQLDSDWNEQLDIITHYDRTEAIDVIGACGVPKKGGGFLIGLTPDGSDLTILPGRIYVDGILVEWNPSTIPVDSVAGDTLTLPYMSADDHVFAQNEWVEILHDGGIVQTQLSGVDLLNRTLTVNPTPGALTGTITVRWLATYRQQPFYPSPANFDQGMYVVYLDVWERHITALEDPDIREIALGGPDTATRTQVIWQVKLLRIEGLEGPLTCDNVPDWMALLPQDGGLLTARTHPEEVQTDPCLTPAGAGYRLLENQLYRVEIHRVNNDGSATFKWSRDNGSIVTSWMDKIGDNLQVSSMGRDTMLGFYGQTFAELTDDTHELREEPGTMVRVTPSATEDNTLTIDTTLTPLGSTNLVDFPVNPKIRRWDSDGELDVEQDAANDGYLELEGGVEIRFEMNAGYRVGDYWLIPARTAVGEQGGDIIWPRDAADPNRPLPQAALGVRHHYCLLAVWTIGAPPQDCRPDFPSLTEICAEDVCFDNQICDLPDAKTVQDVLNYLCQGSDLRFHNKHLHGWGIVCGLQVVCDSEATVRVRSGYAIDCEGRDLRVNNDVTLNINDLAVSSGLNPPTTDGTSHYFLRIDSATNGIAFALELPPETEPSIMQQILQGTLLLDFIQDCIQPLVEALRKILNEDTGAKAGIVSGSEQRLISLVNLLVQLIQRVYGSRVYLSRKEHDILKMFYDELIGVLGSDTFCMLLNTLKPIPDYPFDKVAQDTIFGRGYHRRLRMSPNGMVAYTAGYTNQIHVYDLRERQLVNALTFPASGSLVVQDVAVSQNGERLFAVATDNSNTYFVAGDISGFDVKWGTLTQFQGVRLVTLALRSFGNEGGVPVGVFATETLYAIGKGTGIYGITLNQQTGQFTLENLFQCNAVGHLQTQGFIVVATASQQGNSDVYDSLVTFNPFKNEFQMRSLSDRTDGVATSGQDDILLFTDPQRNLTKLVVEVDSAGGRTNRQALIMNFDGVEPFFQTVIDLAEDSPVHFLYDPITRFLTVAYENSFRLGLVDLDENILRAEYNHPVQIDPVSMGYSSEMQQVFVLNAVSNTITVIDAHYFTPDDSFAGVDRLEVEALQNYRTEMLSAYISLAAGIIQYIKDCFCDHLLVNCPECDEDDKVYLGEITMLNGQVRKVCNFSKRQQVKTFPKLSRWLSLIPVESILDYAVEQICCLVIPDLFANVKIKGLSNVGVKGIAMREGIAWWQNFNLQTFLQGLMRGVNPVGRMFQDTLSRTGYTAAHPDVQRIAVAAREYQVVNQPTEVAKNQLEAANVEVSVQPYDPSRGLQNISNYLGSVGQIVPGSRVMLFTEGGTVKGIAVEPPQTIRRQQEVPIPVDTTALTQETVTLRNELAGLREELNRMQQANIEMLQQRDQQIKTLQDQLTSRIPGEETLKTLQERDARMDELFATVTSLREQIEKQSSSKPPRKPRSSPG